MSAPTSGAGPSPGPAPGGVPSPSTAAGDAAPPAAAAAAPGALPDYSAFYAATERAARELRRLVDGGHLDALFAILRHGGVRLELEAWSSALKQAEFLGHLEPGDGEGEGTYAFEDFLADRVTQWVDLPEGRRVRIHMPDHVCPRCGHDQDNYIVDTRKTCRACSFQW